MGAHFLEGDLDLPAAHEDGDDPCGVHVGVGAEEGLGFSAAFGVAHQDPSDGFGICAGTVAERLLGEDLECLFPLASVPARKGDFCPAGGGVLEMGLELEQGLALLSGPAPLARSPRLGEERTGWRRAAAG